jgi:hypothetical protein
MSHLLQHLERFFSLLLSSKEFWAAILGALIGGSLTGWFALLAQKQAAKHQRERDRETEAVHFKAFLQSIQEEISASWNVYVFQVGHMLENAAAAGNALPYWPCYGDYFVIFKANANNLGMVKNEPLRNALVTTYILAQGHIDTYQAYNGFLTGWEQAKLAQQHMSLVSAIGRAVQAEQIKVQDYYPRLIRSHKALKNTVENCLTLLDAELASSPTELLLINMPVPEEMANT